MVNAKLWLTLVGNDGWSSFAFYEARLAESPLLGFRIAAPMPTEFNFLGVRTAFPKYEHGGPFLVTKPCLFVVRGVVFRTDGTIDVWIGPDMALYFKLSEIMDQLPFAGWVVERMQFSSPPDQTSDDDDPDPFTFLPR